MVRPDFCRWTSKPPAVAASSRGEKYSRCTVRGGLHARSLLESFEHRQWSAAIEVGVVGCAGDDRRDVQRAAAGFLIEHGIDLAAGRSGQRFDVRKEGGVASCAGGIVKGPRAAKRCGPRDHRYDRRDADPAGDEDGMLAGLVERKVVAGCGDRQDVADPELVVNVGRSAASRLLALDGDHIAVPFGLIVDQRIASDRSFVEMKIDVRARGEGGQAARRLPDAARTS